MKLVSYGFPITPVFFLACTAAESRGQADSRLVPGRAFSAPAPVRELLAYAFQVARGMEYLASRNVSPPPLGQD